MKTTLLSSALVRGIFVLLAVFSAAALSSQSLNAQTQPSGLQQAPERKIGKLTVKFTGVQLVGEEVVRSAMTMREGAVYDDILIDRDVRTLYRTGLFEFIEVKREVTSSDVVNLIVEVTTKPRILSLSFEGNQRYSKNRLNDELKSKPNAPLDERLIKEDSEKIRELYEKKGYADAAVTYTIDRDRTTGFAQVVFQIKEGERARIKNIVFEGNSEISDRKLRGVMEETRRWWMFSWLTGRGRLNSEKFEEDLGKLRDHYRELGYLDVDISREKVEFKRPDEGRMVISIPVVEGRRYKVGQISFSGNKIYPTKVLSRVLKRRPGAWFVPSALDKDVESIEDAYGSAGYLETRVRLLRKPNLTTGAIDIEYQITEGEKFLVESVKIEGNTKTRNVVIVRELVLSPGQVFDTVRMKISKQRLENTRYFEDVSVDHETTNIPGRSDLKVVVKEGRTGNVSFGAGFSSVEKATFFAELSQGNFDLFNAKSFFQGDGQKFRLRLQLGSESNEAVISFEEPWLFERQLALGFEFYRTESSFNSNLYDEARAGGQVYMRRRLFGLWEGTAKYRYETITIKNIASSAAPAIQALAGDTVISKFGFTLLRDTRDKIINTTTGDRIELAMDVAGGPLGGDQNYYSIEARGSQFFNIFKKQAQVIAVIARAGSVESFGDSTTVPFYDRYFLGGPTTLRGFEHRRVGPKDPGTGEPLGGNAYGFFSVEYSVDIVSPMRFAVFYDMGFVNDDSFDFRPVNYRDNWGVGLRLFVAGAPLSLDYGIPIKKDPGSDDGSQFNFSFGTRF